jgi:hypothetical protein
LADVFHVVHLDEHLTIAHKPPSDTSDFDDGANLRGETLDADSNEHSVSRRVLDNEHAV